MMPILAVDLGPFFDAGKPALGWEVDNPLAYFNVAAFILAILLLRHQRDRQPSGLATGVNAAAWTICVGTGLHFIGDLFGVAEAWDHQFIHFVVLVAVAALFWGARRNA